MGLYDPYTSGGEWAYKRNQQTFRNEPRQCPSKYVLKLKSHNTIKGGGGR